MDDCDQLCLWGEYEPQLNDYVIWEQMGTENTDEGWVYFKCEEYITIEVGTKPKPYCDLDNHSKHRYIHTLLLCPHYCWNQLVYVKTREHANPQHYSECDN